MNTSSITAHPPHGRTWDVLSIDSGRRLSKVSHDHRKFSFSSFHAEIHFGVYASPVHVWNADRAGSGLGSAWVMDRNLISTFRITNRLLV